MIRYLLVPAVALAALFGRAPKSLAEDSPPAATEPARPASADPSPGDPQKIVARVVDDAGAAIADARVGALAFDQRLFEARTDVEGRAELEVPHDAPLEILWAAKRGEGVDYHTLSSDEHEEHDDAHHDLDQPLELVLKGVRDVVVKVVEEETEEPLADALVIPWYLYKVGRSAEFNVSGLSEFSRRTDRSGEASFDILPVDNQTPIPLLIRSPHHVAHEISVIPPGAEPAEITASLVRMVRLAGRVVGEEGSPVGGATVMAAGDGYHYGYFTRETTTNEDGTFEMEVSPEEYYSLVAQRDESVSPAANFVVRKAEPVDGLELTLEQGTRLFGRVTVAPDDQPVANYELKLRQQPAVEYTAVAAEKQLPNPRESRDYIQPVIERTTRTDGSGQFELYVGPGRYYLVGPFSAPIHRFTVKDEESLEVNLVAQDRGEFTEP